VLIDTRGRCSWSSYRPLSEVAGILGSRFRAQELCESEAHLDRNRICVGLVVPSIHHPMAAHIHEGQAGAKGFIRPPLPYGNSHFFVIF
jgi:hypothetical protein